MNASIMMLTLTTMNDDDISSTFKATIHIPFIFGELQFLIIRIRPNSKNPLFGTALNIATGGSQLVAKPSCPQPFRIL